MQPHFRNSDKSQISGKKSGYYCWKLRKKKVEHYILFRNYSSRLARALSTIRASRATAVKEMFMRKLPRTSYTYLEILVT